MNSKKRRVSPKRQKRNPIFRIAGLVLAALLIYNLYIHFYKNRSATLTVPSTYSSIIDTTALIIRDEVVYNTTGAVKNNDQKVSVGTPMETNENYSNTTGYNIKALESEIKTLEELLVSYDENEISRKELTKENLDVLLREIDQNNLMNVNNWYSENFRNFNLTEDQIYDRLSRLKIHQDIITKQGKDESH